MYTTYILKSLKDQKYYIGSTSNLSNRLQRHNKGLVYSTKTRIPLAVVHKEIFGTLSEARKREIEIKKMKGGVAFKKLLGIL